MSKRHKQMLRRVRLELARDPEFPYGSSELGYDFIAPLDRKGHRPCGLRSLSRSAVLRARSRGNGSRRPQARECVDVPL